jgi:predicted metalloprotease with PDZ domain
MMMPVWSPGFYRIEDYAAGVQDLSARTPDGKSLQVEKSAKNRWRVQTSGAPRVVLSYGVLCNQRSVTTSWVGEDLGVLNGAPTFMTLAEKVRRPHEVRLELPRAWKRAMTALDDAPDHRPNHFRAADFETLVDSPILAGSLGVNEFEVDGRKHYLVSAGDTGQWDGRRAAADLRKMIQEVRRFWGFLPYQKYVFLLLFRQGGGGLEHKNSTLVTSSPRAGTPEGYRSWLGLVAHEYFHAFNVKRLRPVELGPFDWENAPHTGSLWLSEGATTYFANLMLERSGLSTPQDLLSSLSNEIGQLQNSPGRLRQSVEQSSLEVWTNSTSGVGASASTVSYYVKGDVLGFLLDAKVRQASGGKETIDDVMRLAYKRYAGKRGFTPQEFEATVERVAKADLKDWFKRSISSTEELDYSAALQWFGLRFTASEGRPGDWKLVVREDATESQKRHLQEWLSPPRR